MKKSTKQTALQRDVEFVLDAQFADSTWGKRFLRRLVREAIKRLAQEAYSDHQEWIEESADRIAKELIR